MSLQGIEKLSPDLRETRLRVRIDELNYLLSKRTRENRQLRERVDRQNRRLAVIRQELRGLVDEKDRLERKVLRLQRAEG